MSSHGYVFSSFLPPVTKSSIFTTHSLEGRGETMRIAQGPPVVVYRVGHDDPRPKTQDHSGTPPRHRVGHRNWVTRTGPTVRVAASQVRRLDRLGPSAKTFGRHGEATTYG